MAESLTYLKGPNGLVLAHPAHVAVELLKQDGFSKATAADAKGNAKVLKDAADRGAAVIIED